MLAGDAIKVAERLDARYDWLPSPHAFSHHHSTFRLKYYGEGCDLSSEDILRARQKNQNHKKKKAGEIALVLASGKCSIYKKVSSELLYPVIKSSKFSFIKILLE